jgi:signal transduction histidine kinase/ligand-binding sensor domain-containing protein
MHIASRGLLVMGGLVGTASAGAQEPRALTLPPAFVIDQWTTREGLPQNSVNALARAPDGALWIGTFGGLVRFDGATFRLQERTDSTGRHIDRVLSLAVDRDSALWVGTEEGLLRYAHQRWEVSTTAGGLSDDAISTLHVDRTGVLWVGTQRGGLARREAGRFERIETINGAHLGPITSIEEDAAGTVWVNAGDRLAVITAGSRLPRWADPPVPGAVAFALQDRDGVRWYGLRDGVAAVSERGVRTFRRADGIRRPSVMIEAVGGGSWLGTVNDGLLHLQPGGARAEVLSYALPDGRRQFRVHTALVDDEGTAWFGTDADGLLRARRNLFTAFTSAHGLSHDVGTAVYGDAAGALWAATNCGGVNVLELEARTVRTMKPRQPGDPTGDPCVFALTEGPRGTMWAGTYGGGLTRIRGGVEERLGLAGGLRDSVVLALFTDRDGTVWAGTNSGGLARVRDGRVQRVYTVTEGLAHNSVRVIQQTRDGALWVGTLGGLSRLLDGRFTTFTATDGLSAEHVRAIYEDAEGTLWIGTYGGGLNRFHDGVFTAITRRDGLADDVVSSILEDDQGRFWMSGNRGIYRVAKQELVAFAERRVRRVRAVLYGENDGLLNAETNGGFQPAGWKDAQGRMWFPTVRGLAMVDPATVRVHDRAPLVAVEELVVNGVPHPLDGSITIGPGRPNLEFRYTGLSLSAPEHLTFRYRLDGFDDDWVDAGSRRVAYYPRLPPGPYRFEVTAANRDGVWNAAAAGLPLRVAEPVWSTWWFRIVAAMGTLSLIVTVVRRRVAQARARRAAREDFSRQLIESQEHERKRIAGELHDGLGQELLVVKNRALLALAVGDLPPQAREQLEQINGIVAQSLDGVRGLARNLTPYQLDHLGLSEALRAMLASVSAGVDIVLHATVEDVDDLLPADREINLFRIVQEAVNNILRHSGARNAAVSVRHAGGTILVTVRDDGRGFASGRDGGRDLPTGFGLSGIAERVRILGGRLDIVTAPGQGCRLEIIAPVGPARGGGPA